MPDEQVNKNVSLEHAIDPSVVTGLKEAVTETHVSPTVSEVINQRSGDVHLIIPGVDENSPIGIKWKALGNLGNPLINAQMLPDGLGSYQDFDMGAIFYSPAYGAIVVSKAIFDKWKSPSVADGVNVNNEIIQDYLGYPTQDYMHTPEGGTAVYFERGMIVARWNGPTYVVYGMIYEHYRRLGDVSNVASQPIVGLPVSDEEGTSRSGRRSRFDQGDIYWTSATGAWEIHGAIRDRWNALGGPDSPLGYPTTDETRIMKGQTEIGRFNRFEGWTRDNIPVGPASMYWSPTTGAWDVYGAIFNQWQNMGGVTGSLGFPLSGETSTPTSGGRFNNFQFGVIVWHPDGMNAGVIPVQGVELHLTRFNVNDDFNVQINIKATNTSTGQEIQRNQGRMPAGGQYSSGNQDFDSSLLTVNQVQGDTIVNVWLNAISERIIGKDAREGTITATYSVDNVWGLRDSTLDHHDGSFDAFFNMKPFPATVVDPRYLAPDQFRTQLYWPFKNFDTDKLTWTQYAETFRDVTETDKHIDLNPFDFKFHPFEIIFYAAVYNSLAKKGNCFGMCLEALYALSDGTPFDEPIGTSPLNSYRSDRSETQIPDINQLANASVMNEINVKHGYQLGAEMINWFLGRWIAGALHDPVRAFRESRDAFYRGDWPILSVSDNDALSQKGHAVLPYNWIGDDDAHPNQWIIQVANPNHPGLGNDDKRNEIIIDPHAQTFSFQFDDTGPAWTGSNSSGGRLLSIPYSQLNTQPVTLGDEIFALLAGAAIIVLAGAGQTQQITNGSGNTFYTDAHSSVVRSHLGDKISAVGSHLSETVLQTESHLNEITVPTESHLNETASSILRRPKDTVSSTISQREDSIAHIVSYERVINRDPATRLPDMALVPFHNLQQVNSSDEAIRFAQDIPMPEVYYTQVWPTIRKKESSSTPAHHIGDASTTQSVLRRLDESTIASTLSRDAVISGAIRSMFASSLTHDIVGTPGQPYSWAIFSPRMSAMVSTTGTTGTVDTISVNALHEANQAILLALPETSTAKQVTIAITGWNGYNREQAHWFELGNLTLAPGQSIVAQMNDAGQELLLHNVGPTATFELRVYVGTGAQASAIRPNVTLESGNAFSIRPTDWTVLALPTTPITMNVLDKIGGTVIRQVTL